MKLVILVSFLLLLPIFPSGLVETSHLDDIHYEVVTNKGRADLEMDYENPHPSPPKMSDPPPNPYSKKKIISTS
ncbi:hypothetical protein YC2023_113518 [Brassica napus]|uniref:(rape) hypothetical protein n=1 Tax=Brassica napus TaxID=3708 RepID=A0A816IKM2_BRANA|nr:unnamed protein product [Brassica napus]